MSSIFIHFIDNYFIVVIVRIFFVFMSFINKVILVGNVGGEPEIKVLQNGTKVANFSLATNESWKDKNGERKDHTEWHRVSVYGDKLPDIIAKYVKKGTKVYIEGSIRTSKYTTESGVERQSFQIVVQGFNSTLKILDAKGDSEAKSIPEYETSGIDDRIDDSIPF